MDPLIILTVVCAFIAGLAAVFAGYTIWRSLQKDESLVRLENLIEGVTRKGDSPTLLKDAQPNIDQFGEAFRGIVRTVISLNNLFEQAGVALTLWSFLGISFATGFVALTLAILGKAPVAICPIAAVLGAVAPLLWIMRRRQVRFARFEKQLPEALQTMARALRAGHGLNSAMTIVANEFLPPIADEFRRVCNEQALGRSLEESLEQMSQRIPNEDLTFFATSVKLQQRCGGNLAEILDKISAIVRERYRILAQVHALTGEGRLSGTILLAMPIAIFVTVYYLSPEYIEPLFNDPLGRKMTAVAAGLQLIGAFAIRKIVQIKI